jgi:hypothetical protein
MPSFLLRFEYFFGGGIQKLRPDMVPAHFGVRPIRSIALGTTTVDQSVFEDFLGGISSRFTAATYNLLTHNCNNFTDECAQFLLGVGVPEDIMAVPATFLSTPLGQSLAPMLTQMNDRMQANLDPFAPPPHAPAAPSPAPQAAAAAAAAATAGASSASPAASASASSSGAAGSSAARSKALSTAPRVSAYIHSTAPFTKLLFAVNKTLSGEGDGPAPLSETEQELLLRGCTALLAQFGNPERVLSAEERTEASEAAAEMLAGSNWASFHALCGRIVQTWPGRARPAALFLVRCGLLREDGCAYFAEESRPEVMGGKSTLALAALWLKADELKPSAAGAAMGVLQNASAFKVGASAIAQQHLSGLVADAAGHVLRGEVTPGELRASAAAVLANLALAVPAEPLESGELPDDTTSLLLSLVDLVGTEGDAPALVPLITALGALIARGGGMAAALASSMDVPVVLDVCLKRCGKDDAPLIEAIADCKALLA